MADILIDTFDSVTLTEATSSEQVANLLAKYAFTTSINPTTETSGLSVSAIIDSGNLSVFEYPGNYGYDTDPELRIVGSVVSKQDALDNSRYFSFSITPDASKTMSISTLSFNCARGGTSTPRGIVVYSSADSYTTPLLDETADTLRPTWETKTIDVSADSNFQNQTSAITFRIYVYADAQNRSIEFDDIIVSGSVSDLVSDLKINIAGYTGVRIF